MTSWVVLSFPYLPRVLRLLTKTSHVLGTLACGHQVISFASRVHSGGCDGNSRILSGSMDDQDNERYSGLTQYSNILLTSLLILGNLCSLGTKAKSNVS